MSLTFEWVDLVKRIALLSVGESHAICWRPK